MATPEPPFTVTLSQGACEVRDYPAMVVADVSVTGDRRTAASKGFRLLAGYIFGGYISKRRIAMTAPVIQVRGAGEKIAMTAPVLQSGGSGTWMIRFIMPSGSVLAELPTPNNAAVKLRNLPPQRQAVIRFSGLASQSDVAVNSQKLTQFIAAQHLAAIGPPSLAQYDPPWTLWFMRRNEVMIPIGVAGR